MNYSQEELNQILLYKKIDDFYIAIIENKKGMLSDEEYEKITEGNVIYTGVSKEEMDSISQRFQVDKKLERISSKLMKMIYGFSQIRYMGVITIIGDELYDIANSEFVDLKRNKIIYYENLSNYYDKINARTKLFTRKKEPQLKENNVLLEVDDPSKLYEFENDHINQKDSKDLTNNLIRETRKNQHTLSKKLKRY